VSYAETENSAPVNESRWGSKPAGHPSKHGKHRQPRVNFEPEFRAKDRIITNASATEFSESGQPRDVIMYELAHPALCTTNVPFRTMNETEYSPEPMTEEQAPAQETRDEKRRRWAAIRAAAEKNKAKENLLQQALLANASESATPNVASPSAATESSISPSGSPRTGHLDSVPASPEVMLIDKQEGLSGRNSPTTDSPSAADYDPTKDMLDDRNRAAQKVRQSEMSSNAYSETNPNFISTLPVEKTEPIKKQKKDFDMFDFSDDENEDEATVEAEVNGTAKGTILDEKLLDNWDDPEGYYKIISNELVNDGRYRMIKGLGRGVFANVAQAHDTTTRSDDTNQLVAIKMIRRNDLMRKASQKEMEFLRKVNDADPQDKQHIIRLFGSFDHKGHLCAVFEHMSKNLRDLLKEDTNGHGTYNMRHKSNFSATLSLMHWVPTPLGGSLLTLYPNFRSFITGCTNVHSTDVCCSSPYAELSGRPLRSEARQHTGLGRQEDDQAL